MIESNGFFAGFHKFAISKSLISLQKHVLFRVAPDQIAATVQKSAIKW
ncbi:hypothetical protein N5J23_03140 [Comamonas aquatica]|uniref:Uncharacterized protein n=1 Tax=Comamonas aquatica TaxID=225991 RepID=A0AA42L5W7_9BURK|nr:hypothetical protein [Comamonas aquatica]MDE1555806.1 hypothetical protein [Comamonas aquatica]MDH0361621.1 hypothetical protein [Comamonas aquatica]MDH1427508.1 hypothetical protein [Comamonas aquatica]MDH1604658.1 hypothetical protein [Comamonas aquatica]MDH1616787.1 hypothetical protein [Comamonas aquatica]